MNRALPLLPLDLRLRTRSALARHDRAREAERRARAQIDALRQEAMRTTGVFGVSEEMLRMMVEPDQRRSAAA